MSNLDRRCTNCAHRFTKSYCSIFGQEIDCAKTCSYYVNETKFYKQQADDVNKMREELLEEIDKTLMASKYWKGGRLDTIKHIIAQLDAQTALPKFQVGQKVVTKNGRIYLVEQVTQRTCDNNYWYVIIDGDPLSRDCVTESDLTAYPSACEKEIIFTGIYAEAFDLLCNKPNKIADMLAEAKENKNKAVGEAAGKCTNPNSNSPEKTEPSIEQRLAEIERKINLLFKV